MRFSGLQAAGYQYINIRRKEMPWALYGGSKCDLFDYKCAAKEKAAAAAE